MFESSPICKSTGEVCEFKKALIEAVHKRELADLALQAKLINRPEDFKEVQDSALTGKNMLMLSEQTDCATDGCYVLASLKSNPLNNPETVDSTD